MTSLPALTFFTSLTFYMQRRAVYLPRLYSFNHHHHSQFWGCRDENSFWEEQLGELGADKELSVEAAFLKAEF